MFIVPLLFYSPPDDSKTEEEVPNMWPFSHSAWLQVQMVSSRLCWGACLREVAAFKILVREK